MPTPNVIKYSTATQSGALRKGNFHLGVSDRDYGPTVDTGFWSGITPPTGGYTIYLNKVQDGPSIYTAANDNQLISLVNSVFATNSTNLVLRLAAHDLLQHKPQPRFRFLLSGVNSHLQ